MPKAAKKVDRFLLTVTLVLVVAGFLLFSSASLGLLAREGVQFSQVAVTQFLFGVCGGTIALFIFSKIPYRTYRPYAPHLFIAALVLTLMVFIPGLGYEANGARRWLSIFGFSLQPAEILKITFVLALAWYYSVYYRKLSNVWYAVGGLFVGVGVIAVVLLLQPDTGTLVILGVTGVAMTFSAGIKYRHIAIIAGVVLCCAAVLAISRPYLLERVTTFLDPTSDPSGSGYQIKQSLIAVGSGGVFGRGFGQSVQKFNYLPEPIGDSIFSVAAEEFGFFGSVTIVSLFVLFTLRGLYIASRAPDRFGGLTVIGIVILIVTQSYMNIGSMIGLIPLTGEPLTFISHGGTSLFFTMVGVGIVLNVSRYSAKRIKKV